MAEDNATDNSSWWKDAGNFITGAVNTAGQVVGAGNGIIPAAVQAYKQWNDANKYIDMGKTASEQADPFGRYRRGYGDRLQNLYDDPSAIENTPGYKFALNQALDSTQSRLRAQGLSGGSAMQKSLTDEASGMAAQTWDKEANRLAMLSGAQFDPAKAAMMQMEGGKLAVESQNKALDALFTPFRNGGGNTTINNSTGGGSNGGGSGGSGFPNLKTPAGQAQLAQAVMQGGSAAKDIVGAAMAQGIRFVQLPDGSTADLQQFAQHGYDNGDGTTTPYYPTTTADQGINDPNSQFYKPPDYTNDIPPPPTDFNTIPPPDFVGPPSEINFDAIDELFPGD